MDIITSYELLCLVQRFGSKKGGMTELRFGKYNVPTDGKNFLSSVVFKPEEFYSVGKPMQEVFWLEVDPKWYKVAEQLEVCGAITQTCNLVP